MITLHDILEKLKREFALSRKGDERGIWFVYAYRGHHSIYFFQDFQSAPLPANAFRVYRHGQKKTLLHLHGKIPWSQLWQSLWKMIPDPLTDGRLLLALDDYINPKTGKKIFGCNKVFDHAAKQN
ncbi:MAG: hypothetical protein R6V78_01695, partial [Desulfosarcina sp.]